MSYFAAYFGLFFAIGALLGFFVGYVFRGTRPRAPAPAAAAEPVRPAAVASARISSLPGMTPGVATAMATAGITDLGALRAVGESDERLLALADTLRLEDFALRKWVNIADLQAVEGIDGDLANALLRLGVRGCDALAEENPDQIQNKLASLHDAEGLPQNVPSRQSEVEMIAQAAR